MRVCDTCEKEKPGDSFGGGPMRNVCNDCQLRAIKDTIFAAVFQGRKIDRPIQKFELGVRKGKCKERQREHQREYLRLNPAIRLHARLSALSTASKKRRAHGRPTLTAEQIAAKLEAQGNRCFWTGIPMNLYPETERDLFAPSVDRVDNDKGYHDDNVVICCWAANAARGAADAERFREWLRAVVRHAA